MSFQISAVVVMGAAEVTIEVANRTMAPREIANTLAQKKTEMGFDYVKEIYLPQTANGQLRWDGDATKDAVAVLLEWLAGRANGGPGLPGRV
jgi:hypothetical protein